MAKTTAPLMGFGAQGQLGKSIVHASWKGRTYTRRYVVPANPQTSAQMAVRNVFRFLSNTWKVIDPGLQAPSNAGAKGQPVTPRNVFTKLNLAGLRGQTNMTNMRFSGGANGGLAANAIVATAGSSQLSIAFTVSTIPSGWTVTAYQVAVIIHAADPATDFDVDPHYATSASTPIVVTGLATGDLYDVRGWIEWTKPDGTIAYGADVHTTGTPT
jgi:hypothetical protein